MLHAIQKYEVHPPFILNTPQNHCLVVEDLHVFGTMFSIRGMGVLQGPSLRLNSKSLRIKWRYNRVHSGDVQWGFMF